MFWKFEFCSTWKLESWSCEGGSWHLDIFVNDIYCLGCTTFVLLSFLYFFCICIFFFFRYLYLFCICISILACWYLCKWHLLAAASLHWLIRSFSEALSHSHWHLFSSLKTALPWAVHRKKMHSAKTDQKNWLNFVFLLDPLTLSSFSCNFAISCIYCLNPQFHPHFWA